MCSRERQPTDTNADSVSRDESLRLAVAVSVLRSRIFQRRSSFPNAPFESEALRWKRKAKERKQEIIRLRECLKEAEDATHCDLFPQTASCKCYFFDNLGKFSPKPADDASNQGFNDILRRRFLRQVRLKERTRAAGLTQKRLFSDLINEEEAEQLRASVDFLVELCDTSSPGESNFTSWSHQAVDFILASLKHLLSAGKNLESIEGTISSLIVRLVRRMCSLKGDESHSSDIHSQFYVQHLIRKLGSESYIGQRAIFSILQRISVVAESMLFLDPFNESFPNMHESMFLMIQLIEFLATDYLLSWSEDENFENLLLEEWVSSILRAKKEIELLESRNGLYVLYMDRIIGHLAKLTGQVSVLKNLRPDILNNLFHY